LLNAVFLLHDASADISRAIEVKPSLILFAVAIIK
jgi:hypothetical protein